MALLNGQRVRSCLTLAAQVSGRKVTTIEGLAEGDRLHPLQGAFIDYDGFQCGNCTPDQICAASAILRELAEGMPSYVTADRAEESVALSREEVRGRMSSNLCRCAAHNVIVNAVHPWRSLHDVRRGSAWWHSHRAAVRMGCVPRIETLSDAMQPATCCANNIKKHSIKLNTPLTKKSHSLSLLQNTDFKSE